MQDSAPRLMQSDFPRIQRRSVETLQVNLGYRCNLSCTHCHVAAGPQRTEMMSEETVELMLTVLESGGIKQLDLTGGAPEMHPQFRTIVSRARAMGVEVIDRCNLTILLEPDQQGLAEFLADEGVTVVASLPCYSEENVCQQRGRGVFGASITALQQLNRLGYGVSPELALHLVYNPAGASLPPPQGALQQKYKQHLAEDFEVVFNELLVLANMPISRFGAVLMATGQLESYLELLKQSYRAENLPHVMCRSLVSVDWQGYLYDCDFNQMLGLSVIGSDRQPVHLSQLLTESWSGREIRVAEHCYGCTAGQGSSCGGALDDG